MSNPVNRLPTGLVNLLDLAGRAQAPRSLNDELRATIETLPLFLQQRRVAAQGASSPVNLTGNWSCNLVVPQNEYWWVHGYSFISAGVLAAGTTYRIAGGYRPGASGTPFQGDGTDPLTFTAGERPFWAAANVPLIIPSGGDFLVFATAVTIGTAQQFSCYVDYTPFTV